MKPSFFRSESGRFALAVLALLVLGLAAQLLLLGAAHSRRRTTAYHRRKE